MIDKQGTGDTGPQTERPVHWTRVEEASPSAEDFLHPPHPTEEQARTAYDIKGAHRRLAALNDADLKLIPILFRGTPLVQGATYIDLAHLDDGEFVPTEHVVADDSHWYVPKSEVGFQLWNVLIGIEDPERRRTGIPPGAP